MARVEHSRRAVIAGLGLTDMGPIYGRSPASFALEAVELAAADAGIPVADVDGLLTSRGIVRGVDMGLQRDLGLVDLSLSAQLQAFGTTAGAMIQMAATAVETGTAEVVACVFADAPLQPGRSAGEAYGGKRRDAATRRLPAGWSGLRAATGVGGANTLYALAARRHMLRYGTTTDDFAAVAVAQRSWATKNPLAQKRDPMTVEDHRASRWIAEPFRKLDCCLVSNGGVALIVTTQERAATLRTPPVHIMGWAQAHPGHQMERNDDFGLVTGAVRSCPQALTMAGMKLDEIQVVELYDCYTFTVVVSLEDYGFCAKGEGGPFASSGALGPNGTLRVNTGGGMLSANYMGGFTPLAEAIIQVRGEGGDRQAHPHDVALVSGNGGVFDHHCTLVLGSAAAA